MSFKWINKQFFFSTFLFLFFLGFVEAQKKSEFVIVIDPGHGGKDSGARGVVQNEKDIVLDVSLRFGKMIEKKYKDVKVIYTRKTDVFLELWERSRIANKNKANLFVSVHCNAHSRTAAYGTETFVMGLRRMKENIEVSQRENNVILLEENQERYQRFDPNDPEAVIAFEIMHSAYQGQSIRYAQLVEDEFTNNGRFSRGVKQDVFHVLRENASPAVLVELGFISNPDEGAYLASEEGKQASAEAMFRAFEKYKKEYDRKNGVDGEEVVVVEKPKEVEKPVKGKSFKIQFLVSKNKYSLSSPVLKGLTNVEVVQSGTVYKYFYGNTNLASERDQLLEEVKRKGFKDAFVVEISTNEKLSGKQNYRIQFLTSNKRYRERDSRFSGMKNVLRIRDGRLYKYFQGSVKTYEEAEALLRQVQSQGYKNAFIVTFDGEKIIE